jgi:hypothetical protein
MTRYRYEWLFNGQLMSTSAAANADRYLRDPTVDGTLHLKTRSTDTQGYYQCRAISPLGVAMSNVTHLEEAGSYLAFV